MAKLILGIIFSLACCGVGNGVVVLKGSGATTAERFMGALVPKLNKKYTVGISYRTDGSGSGRKQLINGSSHYAFSDVPFSVSEEAKLKGAVKFTFPIALQTISVFVFIPQNFAAIKLTPSIVARIFTRKITKWTHQEIVKLNPNLIVPPNQNIFVVRRRDSSGSTSIFTEWLSSTAPRFWNLGVSGDIKWPNGTLSGKGSAGVAAAMRASPYSIGYLGTSVGYGLGLNEVLLPNKAGVYRKAAGSDVYASIPRTLPPSISAWSGVTLVNRPGKQTWPLTSFLYAFSKRNVVKLKSTGGLLKAFLKYLNSNAAQSLLPSYQFFKLPQSITKKNLAAMETFILAQGVKVPF